MNDEQYLIKYTNELGDHYFSRFELGFPCWVGKSQVKEARVFEGPKRAVRQWIREFLNNNHKYEIVKKGF